MTTEEGDPQPMWSNPERIPARLFKFVPLPYADAFATGVVRIGTFRAYADLDSERADAGEAMVTRLVDNAVFEAGNPHAGKLGIDVRDQAKVYITGGTFSRYVPDMFCFCMSHKASAAPKEPHAIFEILDVGNFLIRLTQVNVERLGPDISIGPVKYERRTGAYDASLSDASPFIKDEAFAWEDEFRAVWQSPNGVPSTLRHDPNISAFLTPPDEALASFIRRL